MTEDEQRELILSLLEEVDKCKRGLITDEDLRRILYKAAARFEQDQWRILEDLRTKAPEGERELASAVADLLERDLRKGHGNA